MRPEQRKKDFFYKQAKKEDYRARSAYKLIDLNRKFNLIKKNDIIVDCGASPGSWSQVALELVGKKGFVLAIDILPMAPLQGPFAFLQADLTKLSIVEKIEYKLPRKADIVISDAAPEFSGIRKKDIGLTLQLNETIFNIAKQVLKQNGNFVCKTFQSNEAQQFVSKLRKCFRSVRFVKPSASLKRSSEVYIVAKNYLQ